MDKTLAALNKHGVECEVLDADEARAILAEASGE